MENIAVMDEHRVGNETLDFAALIHLKAADDPDGPGVFEGLASTFGNADEMGDIILPGAFSKAVNGSAKRIKLLFAHDTREPIGIMEEIEETDKGLRIKGRLLIEQGVPTADKVYSLLKAGALDALSIGFRIPKNGAEFNEDTGTRVLKKIDLLEISIVTFPMNPKAKIRRVKSLGVDDFQTKSDLEAVLRDAGVSRQAAKYVAAGWSPPAQRDVEGELKELASAMTRAADTMAG